MLASRSRFEVRPLLRATAGLSLGHPVQLVQVPNGVLHLQLSRLALAKPLGCEYKLRQGLLLPWHRAFHPAPARGAPDGARLLRVVLHLLYRHRSDPHRLPAFWLSARSQRKRATAAAQSFGN